MFPFYLCVAWIIFASADRRAGTDFPSGWSESSAFRSRSASLDRSDFNAADAWPMCAGAILDVTDQGDCGSCWALAPLLAASARVCILGDRVPRPSAWHAVTCHRECGGCRGGSLRCALSAWGRAGLADARTHPYDSAAVTTPDGSLATTPPCDPSSEPVSFGLNDVRVIRGDPSAIARAIESDGPCASTISVYRDLVDWKIGTTGTIGTYRRTPGSQFVGGHAVRIVGWESSPDGPRWIVANTWGREWGANGTFRLAIGSNECGSESVVHCPLAIPTVASAWRGGLKKGGPPVIHHPRS